MTDEHPEVGYTDVEVRIVQSHEYELVAIATAMLTGSSGLLRIRRQYQALPRHNDSVDPGAVDSNDNLLNRPDEIHVHSKFYAVEDSEANPEEYFLDIHETWIPSEVSVLGDQGAFLTACREHHVNDVGREYAWAMTERRRMKGPEEP